VWEWVADWYEKEYYAASPERNPQGPSAGTLKVMRGGSYNEVRLLLRSAIRASQPPLFNAEFVGFRCAKDAN